MTGHPEVNEGPAPTSELPTSHSPGIVGLAGMTHVSCGTIGPLCLCLNDGRQHGDASSGLSLRASDADEVAGIHGDCDFDAGAGHWREYGAIFRSQRGPAESAGLPIPGPARRGIWKEPR